MEEKQGIKISLSTFFLILALIVIVVMAFFMYKIYNDKNIEAQKATELQAQVNNLQEKMDTISSTVNSLNPVQSSNSNNNANTNTTSASNTTKTDDTKYEITTKNNEYGDEIYAIIKATKDGKTVSKEFEMHAQIADTGTMVLPTIGSVALVADTGGEYYGVNVYQLVNGKIEKLGTINCDADMVTEATYNVTTKDETTVVISAKRNGEIIKNEFEMNAAIAKTEVVDILKRGKVVLVAETGGEYYAFKVFRLSQDYTNGKTEGIIEAGTIQYIN